MKSLEVAECSWWVCRGFCSQGLGPGPLAHQTQTTRLNIDFPFRTNLMQQCASARLHSSVQVGDGGIIKSEGYHISLISRATHHGSSTRQSLALLSREGGVAHLLGNDQTGLICSVAASEKLVVHDNLGLSLSLLDQFRFLSSWKVGVFIVCLSLTHAYFKILFHQNEFTM